MNNNVDNRRSGFGPFARLAVANAVVQGGGLGPLGKIAVVANVVRNLSDNDTDNKVTPAAAPVIQETPSSGGIRGRVQVKRQEIEEKKLEGKEKIEQLQAAASVSQKAGVVLTGVGAVSYYYDSFWAIPEMGLGAVLILAGTEGNTILENMKAIMDSPLTYKEFPSGKWKVEEIGRQLKKDLYISGWVVDNIIIPSKFSNE